MGNVRFDAIRRAMEHKPVNVSSPEGRVKVVQNAHQKELEELTDGLD